MDKCVNAGMNLVEDFRHAKEMQIARPTRTDETGLSSQIICHDMTNVTLPIYPADKLIPQTIDSRCFPGLDKEIVNIADLPAQFYGHKMSNEADKAQQEHESDVSKNQSIMLWSPYRYVEQSRHRVAAKATAAVKYFIADLQPLVGADIEKQRIKDTSCANQQNIGNLPKPSKF
jgi:hypothetical protein